ncbi:MAG: GNAT family N-acetyltransferase [Clostridiales bacterium]|nr:GNAT family N-acetyltransferase [Clostridiales bacterium]
MDNKFTLRRGTYDEYDQYMDFINFVFAPDNKTYFQDLLPKLYKRELNSAHDAFIAFDGDKMVGAVGAFPSEIKVLDKTIKCMGIGNVAAHPEYRSQGIMSSLMNMAIDDMVANGIDFSFLGGQRQRYGYFSYDIAGICISFYITGSNIRHTYGKTPIKYELTREALDPNDTEALDGIYNIINARPYVHVRSRELLYDIMHTWHQAPTIIRHNGKFVGYAIGDGEIGFIDDDYFESYIRTMLSVTNEYSITLPIYETKYISLLQPIASGYTVSSNLLATVLCFKRVTEACLAFKATYTKLVDGSFTALVHGRGGDEKFTISVCNNKVSVEYTDAEPDIELNHHDAMSFFCACESCQRYNGPAVADQWFPLPLSVFHVDEV